MLLLYSCIFIRGTRKLPAKGLNGFTRHCIITKSTAWHLVNRAVLLRQAKAWPTRNLNKQLKHTFVVKSTTCQGTANRKARARVFNLQVWNCRLMPSPGSLLSSVLIHATVTAIRPKSSHTLYPIRPVPGDWARGGPAEVCPVLTRWVTTESLAACDCRTSDMSH